MLLNITDIPEEGLTLCYKEEKAELGVIGEGITIKDDAQVSVRISVIGSTAYVSGTVSVAVSMQCSRCLKVFPCNISSILNIEYDPISEIEKEGEFELKSDELDVGFYKGGILNLTDLVREEIILSIPMRPLCTEDCRGICQLCGKNLNEGFCECRVEEIDPRLSSLKKLLNN